MRSSANKRILSMSTTTISVHNPKSYQPFISSSLFPKSSSHKGENGRVLVIGGSSLFHSASLWSAEVASRLVDIVHYSSTIENATVFQSLKIKFQNGIIVPREKLMDYVKEDDAILIGPGMIRSESKEKAKQLSEEIDDFSQLISLGNSDEGKYTRELTRYLLSHASDKRFVIDAGALQMMDPAWLTCLKTPPILTPHQGEFSDLFGVDMQSKSFDERVVITEEKAKQYRCVLVLKGENDIITNGEETYVVSGGNAGLTKGGTGDVLAGLIVGLYSKQNPIVSAVLASILIKKTADSFMRTKGMWYNLTEIMGAIPDIMQEVLSKNLDTL